LDITYQNFDTLNLITEMAAHQIPINK